MNFMMSFAATEEIEPDTVMALQRAGHQVQDNWIDSYLSNEESWSTAFQRGLDQIRQFNVPIDEIQIYVAE